MGDSQSEGRGRGREGPKFVCQVTRLDSHRSPTRIFSSQRPFFVAEKGLNGAMLRDFASKGKIVQSQSLVRPASTTHTHLACAV